MLPSLLQVTQYESAKQGEYTDLTLECAGIKFPIHRVIVYPQVAAIKAACERGFKETYTRVYSIDGFEPSTVELLREYLYTGDYTTENETRDDYGIVTLKNHPILSEALIPHLRVAAIADYFDIQPLQNLILVKVDEVLKIPWSSEGFAEAVNLAFEVNDETLRSKMATIVFDHLEDLLHQEFPARFFANDLSRRVFRLTQNRKRDMEGEIKELSNEKVALLNRLEQAVMGYKLAVVYNGYDFVLKGTCLKCGQIRNYNKSELDSPHCERCHLWLSS